MDSHLTGPSAIGDGNRFHTWYSSKNYYQDGTTSSTTAKLAADLDYDDTITSDPRNVDSDGDGFQDGGGLNRYGLTQKDPKPLAYNNFIHFGTDEYFEELKEYKASVLVGLRLVPPYSMIRLSNDKMTKYMMEQVNTTDFHNFISDDNWNLFCTRFNGYVDTVTMDIHYFRNKQNRAPATLDELLAEKDKWELLKVKDSVYHMFDKDGEYNLKFVSKSKDTDGKYEAVYNRNGQLLTYVEPGEKYYDKDGNEKTVAIDPVNMGTYNYADPNKDPIVHFAKDVVPYSNEKWGRGWLNVKDSPDIKCSKSGENKDRYDANQGAQSRWNLYNYWVNGGS